MAVYQRQVLEEIECTCGCGKVFMPNRNFQKFFNDDHRRKYYKDAYKTYREFLNNVEARGVRKMAGSLG